ncbi:unnamed protein product [Citrullus colocynthis]|uniref:Uncharacterized protein n=1 Tax=Citrullus colocynthis TaxID=252529 RepID=A0ABP0XWR9_9ROSI
MEMAKTLDVAIVEVSSNVRVINSPRRYGAPPNTLAEYALNQYNNLDFLDISLVDGFNVPLDFSPTSNGCSRGIRSSADINGQCPNELRPPGGCNNPYRVQNRRVLLQLRQLWADSFF